MPENGTGPDFVFELGCIRSEDWPCAGVDEAGRGPLAGPVVAAAVILDPDNIPDGLDDSKRLKPSRRSALFDILLDTALAVSVSSVCAQSIDLSDIRKASLAAMKRAVKGLEIAPRFALVDGRDIPPGLPCPARALIKGDSRSQSIAAASIVAKVTRDRMMGRADAVYPEFGLQNNAGYGTAAHREAIEQFGGVERFHRFSFSPFRQGKLDL
ncbi:MAG: ribonuclease HII [Rhizobiaceae bacterium]